MMWLNGPGPKWLITEDFIKKISIIDNIVSIIHSICKTYKAYINLCRDPLDHKENINKGGNLPYLF